MQTSYPTAMTPGMIGQLYDNGPHVVQSYSALEAIPLGCGVVLGSDENTCRLPAGNIATVTYSTDFIASNVIDVSVNGTAITPVTYATSHAATMAAVAAAVDGLTGFSASATGDVLTITADDASVTLTVTSAVTLGSSQPTVAIAYTSSDIFIGVALQEHTLVQNYDTGVVQYAVNDTVSVLSQGRVYVPTEQTVSPSTGIYLRYLDNGAGKTPGQWRADADTSKAFAITRARWLYGTTGAGVGVLQVNLP